MPPTSEKKVSRNKERRKTSDSSKKDGKGSKYNLKLEKVSSSGTNKMLSTAGDGLKWLFGKKSKSKSKDSTKSTSSSFVNPIPIVVASSGSHVAGFTISPTEEEMQEKVVVTSEAEDKFCCAREQPKLVSVPKTLPQDRISYGYNESPHLQNFHLQGNQALPCKKMIFRPTRYPNGQIVSNPDGRYYRYENTPPQKFNVHLQPTSSPHINRARFPSPNSPRLLYRSHQENYHFNPQIRPQMGPPRPRHSASFPPANFPTPYPSCLFRQSLSGNGFASVGNYAYQQSMPQMQYLQPPIPKQRRSLLRDNNVVDSSTCLQDGPPGIIVPNDQKHPRLPVRIEEVECGRQDSNPIQTMRCNSCVNLSSLSKSPDSGRGSSVLRKYSSHSRLSSRSDFSGSKSTIPWFRWFASRLEKEGHKKSPKNQAQHQQSTNNSSKTNSNCIRCNKKLPNSTKGLKGVINAPVPCSVCALKVCRSCAVWDQSKNSYSCGHCHAPKSIDKRKNFWFDNISSPGICGAGTNFATAERDKVTEDVRSHLENIIENQVDEGIDSVSLSRLFDNSQYDLVFHRFHEELSDALVNLGFSLKLAIESEEMGFIEHRKANYNFSTDKPMPQIDTPTSAHTALTDILADIKEVAMDLPIMEPINKTETSVQKLGSDKEIHPTYEDILATAVINKAILNGQKSRRKVDSPQSLVDSAVQTDSEMSESSEITSQKNKYKDVRGWVTNLEKTPSPQHPNISDDDLSMGTSSSNWSNEGNVKSNQQHQQVVIQEQVEEITTTYESDSDISPKPPSRNRKGRKTARQRNTEHATTTTTTTANNNANIIQDDTLLGVDLTSFSSRAAFPEGGVDIVARSKIDEDENFEVDPTGILISQISEWEQNWLFKRRKQLLRRRNLMAEAVPMLVPNPTDDGLEPLIGDDKASDLSDLSDHVNEEESDFVSSEDTEPDLEETEAWNPHIGTTSEVTLFPIGTNKSFSIGQEISSKPEEREVVPSEAARKLSDSSTASTASNTEEAKVLKRKSIPNVKKTVDKQPIEKIEFIAEPKDSKVEVGKTARFCCIATENSPEFSVAWFHDGQLMTTKEGKSWVYSWGKTHHYLYIYDCCENNAGDYYLALFDFKGNEKKLTFHLNVEGKHRIKPDPPNFTLLQDTVSSSKSDSIVRVLFEVCGYPEPYVQVLRNNVEISKLSHVLLEDKGDGKWNLELRKKDTDFPVYGEYTAVVKNSQGVTRVFFNVQENEESSISVDRKILQQEIQPMKPRTTLNNKQDQEAPSSTPKKSSPENSTDETMREQYHTLKRNQTMVKEDYEAELSDVNSNFDPSKMTIAERERMKWLHPINIPNNPYAPENLEKRIKQRGSGNFQLPTSGSGDIATVTSSDEEKNPTAERKQNLTKFARDYYVHGVKNQPARTMANFGSKFGSSQSLSNASISSREGSNEKDSIRVNSEVQSYVNVPSKSPEVTKRMKQNGISPINNSSQAADPESVLNAEPSSLINPERTSSPDSSVKTATPSPRSRRHNSDLGRTISPKPRETLKSQQVVLPSVKRLAQQFQEPEDKVLPLPEKSTNGYQLKAFPKDPRNFQQSSTTLNTKSRRPSDLALTAASKSPTSKSRTQQKTTEKRVVVSPILTPDSKPNVSDGSKYSTQNIMEEVAKDATQQKEFYTPQEILAKLEPFNSSEEKEVYTPLDENDNFVLSPEINYKSFPQTPAAVDILSEVSISPPPALPATPPPLPVTPPPPKSSLSENEETMLSFIEPYNNTETEQEIETSKYLSFGDSDVEDSVVQVVENPTIVYRKPVEDNPVFLPSVPTAYFSRMMTPQPSLDADFEETVRVEPRGSMDEDAFHSELKNSNVPQPLYKAFNQVTCKKNQNDAIPLQQSPPLQETAQDFQIPEQSTTKTMSIIAQLEANCGQVDGNRSLPKIRSIDEDEFIKEVRQRKIREDEERARTLPSRRLTAMEVLATPTASMLAKHEEEVDMKRLRRSILRGARSGEGLRDAQGLLISDQNKPIRPLSFPSVSNEVNRTSAWNRQPHPLVHSKSQDVHRNTAGKMGFVHSLTARSVSKQFRDGLKQTQPHPADINIKLKASQASKNIQESICNNKGERFIEEIIENQSNNAIDIIEVSEEVKRKIEIDPKPVKKGGNSSNILARAAFWDKRVQEGIVDDDLVIKEFPKM